MTEEANSPTLKRRPDVEGEVGVSERVHAILADYAHTGSYQQTAERLSQRGGMFAHLSRQKVYRIAKEHQAYLQQLRDDVTSARREAVRSGETRAVEVIRDLLENEDPNVRLAASKQFHARWREVHELDRGPAVQVNVQNVTNLPPGPGPNATREQWREYLSSLGEPVPADEAG